MRPKSTRRIAAALGLAVIISTGFAASPVLAVPAGDIVVPLPGMPVEPYPVAITGDSLVDLQVLDEANAVSVTTNRGASWHEAPEALKNADYAAEGKIVYQVANDAGNTDLVTYDLASASITSTVTFPAHQIASVGRDYVVYGTDDPDENPAPSTFAAAPVGDPDSAAELTLPARSRDSLEVLVGAGSRGLAVSLNRGDAARAGTGYLDVVSLTGGDAGYQSLTIQGLVSAAISGQRVYYVSATSANVQLCQRSLGSAESWQVQSCLPLKSGDYRSAYSHTINAGPNWAGFDLWYGNDKFAGGFVADWSTATPKVIPLKPSGAVKKVSLATPAANDLDRPVVIAYTAYSADSQTGYLAKVASNGALTRFAEWPTAPIQPDQVSLSATRIAGVDARGAGTAWQRELAGPGAEEVLSLSGRDSFVSVGRTALNTTSGLFLSDQGKQTAKLSALKYVWQLSGPYLLGVAPKASKNTVLAGSKAITFSKPDYPMAIFGSRVAVINVYDWTARVVDVASGKPVQVGDPIELDDYASADLALWGDHLAVTGYFEEGTEVVIWDYPAMQQLSSLAGSEVAGLSDNVALLRSDDEYRLLDLTTSAIEDLPDAAGWPVPALDGAGRVLYANDTDMFVHKIPFAGSARPRALWTSAAASFNAFAGDTSPWRVSVDATKGLDSGSLVITGQGDAPVTVTLPVAASADGSLRLAWDGTLADRNIAPAGTYSWKLEGFGDLETINGSGAVQGTLTVTNTRVAYPQATPVIDNSKPVVDTVLTVDPGTAPSDVTFSYQWYRDATAIPGAQSATYTVTLGDVGKTIKAKVWFAGSVRYLDGAKLSAATAKVGKATLAPAPVPVLDDLTPVVDQPVTATIGAWGPEPVSLAYQWYKVSSSGNASAITNAKAPVFTPTGGEVGYKLKLKVTGTKPGYNTKDLYSNVTGKVATAVFTSVDEPTITGSVKLGMPLTAVPGATDPGAKYAYQWYRGTSSISGATASVYRTTTSDLGKQLKVRVIYTRSGFTAVTHYSAVTAPIEAGLGAITPKLDDTTPMVGQTLKITEATGIGAWTPADVSADYQWYRDTKAISGATTATYEVQAADAGHTLKVKVTGAKAGYASVAKTSAASSKVIKGVFTSKPAPTIEGTPEVGKTLTAVTEGWVPTPTSFSCVWYRNGAVITGATHTTYVLADADAGKSITVKVTGLRAGFTSATAPISAPFQA